MFICLVLCLAVCCAWAAADGLILKDAEGNILEDGARLEGKYYYIIYVEGAPEECEGIDTAWVQGEPDAEEPGEWSQTSRHLYTDENGRFIVVMPILGQEYTEETMFARLDENDPVLRKISFSYNCGDTIESELPMSYSGWYSDVTE